MAELKLSRSDGFVHFQPVLSNRAVIVALVMWFGRLFGHPVRFTHSLHSGHISHLNA